MKWQAVFFDFDGVIVDSVGIKTNAFAEMFRKYGDKIEGKVVSYHLEHLGMSRFDKFRYYYEHLLRLPVNEKILNELSEEFSRIVLTEVIASPYIQGVSETLNTVRTSCIPSYVVSGTPDDEMKLIVKLKGLNKFFEEVHGSPRQKSEIIADILNRKSFVSSECLFIGDAMTDYNAALENGVRFLGIVRKDDLSEFPKGTWISDSVIIYRNSSGEMACGR